MNLSFARFLLAFTSRILQVLDLIGRIPHDLAFIGQILYGLAFIDRIKMKP